MARSSKSGSGRVLHMPKAIKVQLAMARGSAEQHAARKRMALDALRAEEIFRLAPGRREA